MEMVVILIMGICEYIFVIRDIVYYGVVCQENICSSEVISMILIFFFSFNYSLNIDQHSFAPV